MRPTALPFYYFGRFERVRPFSEDHNSHEHSASGRKRNKPMASAQLVTQLLDSCEQATDSFEPEESIPHRHTKFL